MFESIRFGVKATALVVVAMLIVLAIVVAVYLGVWHMAKQRVIAEAEAVKEANA